MRLNVKGTLAIPLLFGMASGVCAQERRAGNVDDGQSTGSLLPPEAGNVKGPIGTSGAGTARYDRVGFARPSAAAAPANGEAGSTSAAVPIVHPVLPAGSFAEITALDNGRVIVARVDTREMLPQGVEIMLSPAAVNSLALADGHQSAVRVRDVIVSPADRAAIGEGRGVASRLNAPPALLAALRRQFPTVAVPTSATPIVQATAMVAQPRIAATLKADGVLKTTAVTPPTVPVRGRSYAVQVAALSDQRRAEALATQLGGSAQRGGSLFRIRLGPYASRSQAERARDDAVRRGYGDAAIIVQP